MRLLRGFYDVADGSAQNITRRAAVEAYRDDLGQGGAQTPRDIDRLEVVVNEKLHRAGVAGVELSVEVLEEASRLREAVREGPGGERDAHDWHMVVDRRRELYQAVCGTRNADEVNEREGIVTSLDGK